MPIVQESYSILCCSVANSFHSIPSHLVLSCSLFEAGWMDGIGVSNLCLIRERKKGGKPRFKIYSCIIEIHAQCSILWYAKRDILAVKKQSELVLLEI